MLLFTETENFGPGPHRNLQVHSPLSPQVAPRVSGSTGFIPGQLPGLRPPFPDGNKMKAVSSFS